MNRPPASVFLKVEVSHQHRQLRLRQRIPQILQVPGTRGTVDGLVIDWQVQVNDVDMFDFSVFSRGLEMNPAKAQDRHLGRVQDLSLIHI